jgi:maltooligosyltrehalose trehalohydrolase
MRSGWYYSGQFSNFRRRRHGNSTHGLNHSNFVVCNQNHDQVGNRARGERLSQLVNFEGLKLGAGMTLLSPFVPLLFMGEEYGESAPFQYFTSHGDPALIEAVRRWMILNRAKTEQQRTHWHIYAASPTQTCLR